MKPDGVMESCLYARDLAAAEGFYTSVLGLGMIVREEGRHVFFRCGAGVLLIFNPDHTSQEETHVDGALVPLHGTTGAGHLAFRVASDTLVSWRRRLDERGIAIESEVKWPRGGHSIYFRDPAGNSVELVTPETWREGPMPKDS
jgi:catechol 2,3-dioxygenase-like lactoylglutathione lyase family enzyme